MSYANAERLIALARLLAGRRYGMTLDEMQEAFGLSRRSAERLRDAVEQCFPGGFEGWTESDGKKRWRLREPLPSWLTAPTAEELAALDVARAEADRAGNEDLARRLRDLASKAATAEGESPWRRDPDLQALTEAEGIARRPGPRPKVDRDIISILRQAILAAKAVRLTYRSRETGKRSRQRVCPYGFLYGQRNYLVAYSLNPQARDYRLFALANIEAVEPTERGFVRDPDFDLTGYAARSFGSFQEEPQPIVLRFAREAAEDARSFHFHSSQQLAEEANGEVTLTFTAGGLTELAWHLFTWGDAVTVVRPQGLRDLLVDRLTASLTHHQKGANRGGQT